MAQFDPQLTRRSALFAAVGSLVPAGVLLAAEEPTITVHKGSNMRLLLGSAQHLRCAWRKGLRATP